MYLNEFVNRTVSEMLNKGYDDQSFRAIVAEAVSRTAEECAQMIEDYSLEQGIRGQKHADMLRKQFK